MELARILGAFFTRKTGALRSFMNLVLGPLIPRDERRFVSVSSTF